MRTTRVRQPERLGDRGTGVRTFRVGRPARSVRVAAAIGAGVAAAILVSACSVLGLSATTPPDATIVTSAAPVANTSATGHSAVTVPTLGAASTGSPAPTPWESLISSEPPPSTSEAPLTAPTTTRTLTFATFASATQPTVAPPSLAATPPPDCYAKGTCKALDSATAGSGTVLVVNPPGGANSVAILTVAGKPADSLSLAALGSPKVGCAGAYCLVQGSKSGVWFGTLVAVAGGRLAAVTGSPVSAGPMRLVASGSTVLVGGTQRFTDYGLPVTDAPVAARTWTLSGGALASTGCGQPVLYSTPSAVNAAQNGPCSGTPQIAGYGAASANKIVYLGGFATQSGNIACAVVPGGQLACTAKKYSFSVATCTQPESKVPSGLRGLRVLLGKSGAASYDGCLGYTLIGSPATSIGYGRLAAGGGFVCSVEQSGVSCTAPSGRGFVLSGSSIKTS